MGRPIFVLLLSALAGAPAVGQSVLEAPANLSNAWVAVPATVQFNLLHRFNLGPAPSRKVINSPTIGIVASLFDWLSAGFNYAPNSELVQAYPNEWEFFGRAAALRQEDGAPFGVFVQAGYDIAARSTDAAVIVGREFGRLRLVATAEAFSHAFDAAASRYAAGGGFSLRVSPLVAISADAATLTERYAGERVAWSGGVQFGVPNTPHTLSLHVTNVNGRTLEGVARGTLTTRYGFEYSIPITLRRYFGARTDSEARHPAPMQDGNAVPRERSYGGPTGDEQVEAKHHDPGGPSSIVLAPRDTVVIDVKSLSFGRQQRIEVAPGTLVIWRNRDPLAHFVVANDKSFESPPIEAMKSWVKRFDQAGTFNYHCVPHPFMRGTIVVK
jgi:plastocyanin